MAAPANTNRFIPSGDFSIPLTLDDIEDAPLTPRLACFQIFDAYADPQIGYAMASLFESSTPGAVVALYAWAAARSLAVEVRDVADSEHRVHVVKLPSRTLIEVFAHRSVKP